MDTIWPDSSLTLRSGMRETRARRVFFCTREVGEYVFVTDIDLEI